MKQLWAPWRSQYMKSFSGDIPKKSECFFCEAAEAEPTKYQEHLVVYRGKNVFVILNRYPYNSGHVMVTPIRHCGDIVALSDIESSELMSIIRLTAQVLQSVYSPDGINVGANLGQGAGAGVPGHLHFHLLPRWNGDTNFLPIIAETKVISESLDETWHKLTAAFTEVLYRQQ